MRPITWRTELRRTDPAHALARQVATEQRVLHPEAHVYGASGTFRPWLADVQCRQAAALRARHPTGAALAWVLTETDHENSSLQVNRPSRV